VACSETELEDLWSSRNCTPSKGISAPQYRIRRPSLASTNQLQHQFTHVPPEKRWVNDIANIRIHKSCAYMCIEIDLQSGLAVGWSMKAGI